MAILVYTTFTFSADLLRYFTSKYFNMTCLWCTRKYYYNIPVDDYKKNYMYILRTPNFYFDPEWNMYVYLAVICIFFHSYLHMKEFILVVQDNSNILEHLKPK